MHYYTHNIGDHSKRAFHLTNEEDLAFRRLKDMYYDTELPIPKNIDQVSRRIRVETHWVSNVLKDFFFEREDGWHIDEIDAEIDRYRKNSVKNAENGRKGGRPPSNKKPTGFPVASESNPNGNPNQQPTTNNQQLQIEEKLKKEKTEKPKAASDDAAKKRGRRLPDDWSPSQALWDWTFATHPNINAQRALDEFHDYWATKSGRDAVKLDWDGVWRNRVRQLLEYHGGMPQKAAKQPHSAIEYVTVMG